MDNKKLNKKFKVLKVRDKNDNYSTDIDTLYDLPMRLILSGASGSGKSSYLVNLLLNENYPYKRLFQGEDVYIFAPDPYKDNKLNVIITELDVPESNVFDNYSDELLDAVYENLLEEYQEAVDEKKRPTNKILILDDLSFSSKFAKRFNTLGKVFQNGRKFLVSVVVLSQYYNQVSPAIRMNASGVVFYRAPNSQIEKLEVEHNFLLGGKKSFLKMVHSNNREKNDFVIINYSNPSSSIYLNKDHEPISAS